jgi:hypothetical protein
MREKKLINDSKKEMVKMRVRSSQGNIGKVKIPALNLKKLPHTFSKHPIYGLIHSPRLTSYQRRLKKSLKKQYRHSNTIDSYFIYGDLKSTRITSPRHSM